MDVRRFTAVAGLVTAVIQIAELPLYFATSAPPTDGNVLTRVLLSLFTLAFFTLFLAGFRRLAIAADPEYEWVASLAYGVGLMYVAITFIAHSAQAGAVIGAEEPI